MTRGNYYTSQETKSYGTTYDIWLRISKPVGPFNDEIIIAGFAVETERDKYFDTFTDEELATLEQDILSMWSTDDLKSKMRLSGKIERLKNAVQKRAGIVDT